MATESFFSNASLAYLASAGAGKDGKTYSIKPNDGTGDFTFSRGSNLAATRVGADGLIEKGRENLLLQSNQFDTTWIKISTNVTGGQSGYDGTNNAWLIESTADSSAYLRQNNSQSGLNTFSIYAKAGTADFLCLYHTNGYAFFNVSTGEVGFVSGITASIVSVGSGWYRCSFSSNATFTQVRAYVCEINNSLNATIGSNIYIQDAQLEIGLAATDYIETGATTGKAGLLEDEPRFDYSGGATCASLLLEPSRTNLFTQSEYFDVWAKTGASVSSNTTISPEGKTNAATITGAGSYDRIYQVVGYTAGDYTFSVFVKKTDTSQTFAASFGPIQVDEFSVNLNTGVKIYQGSNITSVYSVSYGDYWRVIATSTRGNETLKQARIFAGYPTNISPIIWGAQLEAGSYPTSYIPNHSGGSVTRGAEECTGAGDATTFNASEGVFYAEISTNTDITDKVISLNNNVIGAPNNRLWMGYSSSFKRVYALGYVNNSFQFALNKLMTDESLFVKIACKYAENDVAFFVNGEKVGTDTSALAFTELTSMDFNIGNGTNSGPFYGNAKQVLVFNEALSDADCIALTTL